MLSPSWSLEWSLIDSPHQRSILNHCCYWHYWRYDSIYHRPSAPQLQVQRWSKFINLIDIPLKMTCFSAVRAGMVSPPSIAVVNSSSLCCRENWHCRVTRACFSSPSSIHAFDFCILFLKPGISFLLMQLCRKANKLLKSTKSVLLRCLSC